MIFSYKELVRIANLETDITIDRVVDALNKIGFEVESVTDFANVKNVKLGKIIEVFKNPNGTKLNVCKVKFSDKIRTIQTTAQNVVKGMIVGAFIVGSQVNGVTFQARKIRGIISEGMLTNVTEFGINEEFLRPEIANDIYDYKTISIDEDLSKLLGLNDKIIDINILANRNDAASYYVMAMELAAFFKTAPLIPELKNGNLIATRIVTSEGLARSLTLVEAKNNFNISLYEQILLAKHKIKSVNNGVDLTNLALLYSGLPIHIYDDLKIGNKIKVIKSNNEVIGLGNKTIKLNNNLVIADEKNVISVASIIGLENTKVTSKTKNLVIEIARFLPQEIRKSLLNVKLETRAAQQGIKENSAGMVNHALIYLTNKLKDFSKPINFRNLKQKEIAFNISNVNEMVGQSLTNEYRYQEVIIALTKLGFEFNKTIVKVPLYRYDIFNQADLNEEIIRFYGYDHFQPLPLINYPLEIKEPRSIKCALQAQGYSEVRTYTLTSSDQNKPNPFDFKEAVKLQTFVSKARMEIRNSQALSLLKIADYNTKQGISNFTIFSQGMINDGIGTIALLSNEKTFNQMKNDIACLISNSIFKRLKTNELHSNIAATINIEENTIGWIGQVHPRDAHQKYIIAEFKQKRYKASIKNVQKYKPKPLKSKDINILLKPNEDLIDYLAPYKNAYAIEMVDDYKVANGRKITIRIYK